MNRVYTPEHVQCMGLLQQARGQGQTERIHSTEGSKGADWKNKNKNYSFCTFGCKTHGSLYEKQVKEQQKKKEEQVKQVCLAVCVCVNDICIIHRVALDLLSRRRKEENEKWRIVLSRSWLVEVE